MPPTHTHQVLLIKLVLFCCWPWVLLGGLLSTSLTDGQEAGTSGSSFLPLCKWRYARDRSWSGPWTDGPRKDHLVFPDYRSEEAKVQMLFITDWQVGVGGGVMGLNFWVQVVASWRGPTPGQGFPHCGNQELLPFG